MDDVFRAEGEWESIRRAVQSAHPTGNKKFEEAIAESWEFGWNIECRGDRIKLEIN